jgi:hypothetical protein
MPKASKATASDSMQVEGYEGHFENFDGGYTVGFETYTADADMADLFKGLPDDRCQCEHWGYVIKGKVSFKTGDGEETFETGDAYYVGPVTRRCSMQGPRSSSSVRRRSCNRRWRSSRRTWSRRPSNAGGLESALQHESPQRAFS